MVRKNTNNILLCIQFCIKMYQNEYAFVFLVTFYECKWIYMQKKSFFILYVTLGGDIISRVTN